jgi:hypothetical protein
MQPVRPKRVEQRLGLGDQLAEWLVRHCPLTTLALLSLVVIASTVTFDRPWIVVGTAAAGDATLTWVRRARRSRAATPARLASSVPA